MVINLSYGNKFNCRNRLVEAADVASLSRRLVAVGLGCQGISLFSTGARSGIMRYAFCAVRYIESTFSVYTSMSPIISSHGSAPVTAQNSMVVDPKDRPDQRDIQRQMDEFGCEINKGMHHGDRMTLNLKLAVLIRQINRATDRGDKGSDVFSDTGTNQSENLSRLKAMLESIPEDQGLILVKQGLIDTYRAIVEPNKHESDAAEEIQIVKKADKPGAGTTATSAVRLGDRLFNIELTTAGLRGGKIANDCLAYALQVNNEQLLDNYREHIFTPRAIEDQLECMRRIDDEPNAYFEWCCNLVAGHYAIDVSGLANIRELSSALAQHIQSRPVPLDAHVAGGVFARNLNRPIVFVAGSRAAQFVYSVINNLGQTAYTGDNFNEVAQFVGRALFVHHNGFNHFERMTMAPIVLPAVQHAPLPWSAEDAGISEEVLGTLPISAWRTDSAA